MAKKIIGYVSECNPYADRYAWSGLIYKIREAIEMAGYDVVWIEYRDCLNTNIWERLRKKIMSISGLNFLGGVHYYPIVKQYGHSIDSHLLSKCDYVFFPRGGQIGPFLKSNKPIIYYADATVYNMINYYWFNVHIVSKIMSKCLERNACRKARINIRASHWAIDSVINDCKCLQANCYVLPFGANIDELDIKPIVPYHGVKLNMLFSGVDWDRKGGLIAVRTMELLRSKGINAVIHIVGVNKVPSQYKNNPNVVLHGFLNKNNKEDYLKYINIWKNTHIFILPTKAECAGVVFCESSAFGIPCYTYNTGGTSDYVLDGINGHCLPLNSDAESFAHYIYDDIINNRMELLHKGALDLYKKKLSWHAWSMQFRKILESYGSLFQKK